MRLLLGLRIRISARRLLRFIPLSLWVDYDKCQALFVKEGKIEDCMDSDIKLS